MITINIEAGNLREGSKGQAVRDLQRFLGIPEDGIFGPQTKAAVQAYQQQNGLTSDGIVGPVTSQKMNTIPASTTQPESTNSNTSVNNTNSTNNNNAFSEDYNKSGDTRTSFYDATVRNEDWEKKNVSIQKGIGEAADASNLISSSFLNKITSDPSLVAFYVNALTYGGYQIGDILNDMKRRELIDNGDTNAKSLKIIDPTLNRSTYQATAEGQKAVKDAATMIPTFNLQGLMNPEILKYGSNIPDELFKTLVPIQDKNSTEFKDAVAKVKAGYYDLATATLQATTEQEKAIADYNLKNFTEQINRQYGIALSDDATKAWSQIEDLENNMSQRGLSGSGLENEGIDDILANTRKQDQRLRQDKLTKEEAEKASYYTSSASEAEIAKLTPEEREKYGLTPSAEIKDKFSIAALKKQYPNKSDSEIKAMHDAVLDANGNYRSKLYSNYYGKAAANEITNQTNAEQQVLLDAQNKEDAAYRNYDQSQLFGSATAADDAQVQSDLEESTDPQNQEQANADAEESPKNNSSSVVNYNANTGAKLKAGESYTDEKTGKTYTQGETFNPQEYSSVAAAVNTSTKATPTNTSSNTNTGSLSLSQIQKIVGTTVDGINGPKTQAAIKAYQTANGLVADGIVGPKTLAVMQSSSNSSNNSSSSNSSSTPKLNTTPTVNTAPKTNSSSNSSSNISSTVNKPKTTVVTTQPTTINTVVPKVTTPTTSTSYKVASGDTLSAIAAKNKTTVSALAKLNGITDPNKIKAGQTIKFS